MIIFDHIDRALRHLREGRRTRQYQIAEEAGITKAMLSSYETGKQKPSLETLDKILEALGCDLVDLHEALAVFQADSPRERPMRPPSRRLSGSGAFGTSRPVRGGDLDGPLERSEASDAAETDVYSTLGIEQPLAPDEERALGEVLTGFHKLLRHLHETARQTTESRAETGDSGRSGRSGRNGHSHDRR